MAKECFFTGRKAASGNNRSHAMNANKRKFGANLQKVRVMVDGQTAKGLGFSTCPQIRQS